jgi:hypothetical protein
MTNSNSTAKVELIRILRDRARQLVRETGKAIPGIHPTLVEANHEGLTVCYCSEAKSVNGDHYLIVDDDREIATKRRRKLSLWRFENGDMIVSSFRAGDWQKRLRSSRTTDKLLGRNRGGIGFLSHLRSLAATMSQKSSVPQLDSSVSQVLKRERGQGHGPKM